MADKTPVRVVFNGSNVATGMAEFQTGETVPVANGGTGLASIGSAGQVLKVNTAGSGLEFSGEGDISITNLVAPTNADLTFTTSGTGGIILNDITISDNAISTNRSNDDFKINASGTGTVNLENLKIGTGGATVTTILDEDSLTSDSATSLATQQSIKAYVDSEITAVSTTSISQGNSNVTVVDSGTGNVTIEVDGTDRITTLATTTTTATGHSLVIGAGSTSTAGQIKFLEGTDNGTNGATLIGPAATTDVTVTLPAATDTLVGKATADTFTNKTIDANGTGNSITNLEVADLASGVLDTDITSVSGSDDTLASAKAIKTYVDAQVTASDLDFATDDSTALSIDLDSESLQVSGGANISTSGSANTITIALDTALAGLTSVTSTALVTNSISSSDSTAVRIDDALNVDGALDVGAGFTISNTTSITSILDEDAMGSDSATALATQQSIKAYVDTQDAAIASDTLTFTNKTFDVEGTGNSISNIDVGDLKSGVLDTDISSVSGSDDTLASAKAIKTYVDSQVTAQDLDFATDDSTALSIDLDSEVLQVSGGANITTSGSANTITIALDTALTGLSSVTSTAIVTNNISSSDSTAVRIDDALNVDGALDVGAGLTISNGTSITAILDEDAMGSDSATSLATQQSIKAYADTKAVLSGSTNNQITTVTGAHAIQGESNLTFDGSTLAVTGAGTFGGVLTATSVTSNDFTSNGSNADINITPAGTGGVVITSGGVAFTLPTADGSSGDVLKTDGSGTLTFASSTATPSDDTRVVVKNNKSVSTSARTMDYFQSTSADLAWYFVALNDLTNDHSSASCFAVAHNNSDAFISGARGGSSGTDNTVPTTSADISSGQVRVKITAPSADSKISYYKIPISRANTADATAGVTVTTSNTDVDSASESIDTFAHSSFRAAKYLIIIDDNAKTETGVTEALVVHDGSSAFVTQYGTINTGNNDMITLSAEISGSNVVLSAAGLTPNLSLKIHKTLLSDSMSAVSNANQKIIGATTVSSSATAFDSFDLDDATAAMYYVVGGNSTEGHYSVQEVYCSGAPGEASVSHGPFVSTKATVQLEFTAAFDADEDNTLQLSVSSTSGGSTTVNAYRINCLAE